MLPRASLDPASDPPPLQLNEDVRLVVWDLDDTFWRGALSEGAVEIPPAHAALVCELNARGIVNAICSKNDLEAVQRALEAEGLWDAFVFPDVSWDAKGPRMRRLLERMGLRAASVLFLDDNPTNLAEAQAHAPGLQVADPGRIPELADHPRLAGKPDPGLARVRHYRQLQSRSEAQAGAGAGARDFLRQSAIEVEFVYDLQPHLDRVVELINRTNQLNFTKSRLPEEPQAARAALARVLDHYAYQCALVRVRDAYGDHGLCGLYVYEAEARRLLQFCFSCRILGLGVEQWVYDKLGRPAIEVVGEVRSELVPAEPVDWINQAPARAEAAPTLPWAITARGGCEIGALAHYFLSASMDVAAECNLVRDGVQVRLDHTAILPQALAGLDEAQLGAARMLHFEAQDFRTRLLARGDAPHAVVLSFAIDAGALLFRHRASGFVAPVFVDGLRLVAGRLYQEREAPDASTGRLLDILQAEFDPLGPIGRRAFVRNVATLLDAMPASTQVFVLGLHEGRIAVDGRLRAAPVRSVLINRWTRAAARGRPNVHLLRLEDYTAPDEAMENHFHFRRAVYFRVFRAIRAALEAGRYDAFKARPGWRARLRSAWTGLRTGATAPLREKRAFG